MAMFSDERPPIIVRGGSLVFQSGDGKSTNPKHNKGRPWKDVGKDQKRWKQVHDTGKHVATYAVSFQGGGGHCSPTHATEVHVTYKLTSGEQVVAVIGRDKSSNGKDMEPLVTCSRKLNEDNGLDQPTLTLPDKGEIVSIAAGGNVCTNPVSAILQPINGKDGDQSRSRTMLIVLGTLAAVAIALAFAFGAFDRNGDEERPPIIVRNGSIVFENQLVSGTSTGQSKLWVPSGTRKWKPDHDEGHKIKDFEVSFSGVECSTMTGHPVRITRVTASGKTEEYRVKREGFFRVDPKVEAPVDVEMTVDNTIPKTTLASRDTGGAITEVRIGNASCDTSSASNPEIMVKPR